MKKLMISLAVSAVVSTTALAQSNLEKLGSFKTTGITEHTVIDQNTSGADSIRDVLSLSLIHI